MGLLSMGLRLLGSKGSFGHAVGEAGHGALGDAMKIQDRSFQNTQRQMQMEQLKRQQQLQQQQDAWRQNAVSPQMQASQAALGGGGGPTMANAAKAQPVDPNRQMLFEAMQAGVIDPQTYIQSLQPKAADYKVVGDALLQVGPGGVKEAYRAPEKPEKEPEALRAIASVYGKGSPEYMQAARNYITKTTTHQPGVSVSYGQPVAGVDASGNPVFFQPAKGGGQPAIVPGVKPAPQNRDTKLPAELQRMQIAGDSMVELMDEYERMLKKHNPRDPLTQANPTVRADMQSLKRNIELQFKELQALGALAGPDIEIMRQSMADPFSMSGAYYGRDGLLAQVRQARNLVKIRKDAVLKSQGREAQIAPDAANADPLGLR